MRLNKFENLKRNHFKRFKNCKFKIVNSKLVFIW